MFYNHCSLYPNFGGVVVAEEEGQNIAQFVVLFRNLPRVFSDTHDLL
jgi:hypothetical protein